MAWIRRRFRGSSANRGHQNHRGDRRLSCRSSRGLLCLNSMELLLTYFHKSAQALPLHLSAGRASTPRKHRPVEKKKKRGSARRSARGTARARASGRVGELCEKRFLPRKTRRKTPLHPMATGGVSTGFMAVASEEQENKNTSFDGGPQCG